MLTTKENHRSFSKRELNSFTPLMIAAMKNDYNFVIDNVVE